MKLFGRGRSDRPEVRLRRAVERAGQPITHHVSRLLGPFGYESATPEARAEVDASLASVGLTTNPRLSEVDGDAAIEVQLVEAGVPVARIKSAEEPPVQPHTGSDEQLVSEGDAQRERPTEAAAQLHEQQDQYDAQVSALRDEFQTQLASAREEAASERRVRHEVETRLVAAKEELEAKAAELADAERRIDDAHEQRLSGILEVQESAREEREQAARHLSEARAEHDRLEVGASEEVARRDAERAEAQRKADEAFALLEAARAEEAHESASGMRERPRRPDPAPLQEEPSIDEEPRPAEPATPDSGSNGTAADDIEHRVPAFHQPPPTKSPSRLSLPKLGRGRKREKESGTRYTCAVTGAEAPTDSEWELRRHGWIISGENALSPEAQADGWQYPDGAALPFRKLSER